MRSALGIVALGLGLASCGPAVLSVQVQSADPQIRSALSTAADEFNKSHPGGPSVRLTEKAEEKGLVVLGFARKAPSGPGLVLWPADFASVHQIVWPIAISRWAQGPEGRWQAVPLWWMGLASSGAPGDWASLKSTTAPGLGFAGAEPFVRQALFETMTSPESGPLKVRVGRFAEALAPLKAFPDAWRLGTADLEALAGRPVHPARILYDTRHVPGATPAELVHWTGSDGAPGLAAAVLSGWYQGPPDLQARAAEWLAYLASGAVQNRVASQTHLYPANVRTPPIDGVQSALEDQLLKASTVRWVNPEPAGNAADAAWDSALKRLVGDPAHGEAALAEYQVPANE